MSFFRHFKDKNDLKAELIRRGFEILYEGMEDVPNNFSRYGAHYIRFELDCPHIYDLMFGNIDLDMSLYPDLEAQSNGSFNGIVEALESFMPDESENDLMIKAYNVWASGHGIVGILRRKNLRRKRDRSLEWIENNLEEYLVMDSLK